MLINKLNRRRGSWIKINFKTQKNAQELLQLLKTMKNVEVIHVRNGYWVRFLPTNSALQGSRSSFPKAKKDLSKSANAHSATDDSKESNYCAIMQK